MSNWWDSLPDVPQAGAAPPSFLAEFEYGAWMVANLTLKSRPKSKGFPFAWDNVLYDSPSLGYVVATHQRCADHGPTVLTYPQPGGPPGAGVLPPAVASVTYLGKLVYDDPRIVRDLGFSGVVSGQIIWTFGDTLSWTKGKHAFKAGSEFRFASSNGWNDSNMTPQALFGAGGIGQGPGSAGQGCLWRQSGAEFRHRVGHSGAAAAETRRILGAAVRDRADHA